MYVLGKNLNSEYKIRKYLIRVKIELKNYKNAVRPINSTTICEQ